MKLSSLLLMLYPKCWRVRYGDEFREVLDARRLRFTDICDIALNALDTHINPNLMLVGDTTFNERMMQFMQKLRSAEIVIFGAWIAFVVAGLNFFGLVDDSPYIVQGGKRIIDLDMTFSSPLSGVWTLIEIGSMIALIAVLVGGVPLAFAVWQRSPNLRRNFLVPVLAFVAILVPPATLTLLILFTKTHVMQSGIGEALRTAYEVYFIGAAILSTRAVARAIANGDVHERLLRFALLPGAVTTLAMMLMLSATFAWGILAHLAQPAAFDTANYFTGYLDAASWGLIVVTMAIATVTAAVATLRGFGARGQDTTNAESTGSAVMHA